MMSKPFPNYLIENNQAVTMQNGLVVRHEIVYCVMCNEPFPKVNEAVNCPRCHAVN